MKTFNIEEIKSKMEGMSLQEKEEYLQEVYDDIKNEIEKLEEVESGVLELLGNVAMQIRKKYHTEIGAALNDVIVAHSDEDCTSTANTLEIAGLRFCFLYWPGEGFNELSIGISGREPIIRTGDFNAEFGDIVKQLFPEAKYGNMSFEFSWAAETDAVPMVLVKDIAEKLLSIAPKIAEIAGKYRFV